MSTTPRIRVLLVDDEQQFVEVVAERLENRGISVNVAFDGRQALARLADADPPQVVVLDLTMPGMDGLEVLERIKAVDPLIEVVILTGKATLASAVEAIRRGAFDYLMKPCDIDYLMGRIGEAAARRGRREAKIREVQTTPYISDREREERIARILSLDR